MTQPLDTPTPSSSGRSGSLRLRRLSIAAAWIALSVWEGIPIYMAYMTHSENQSKEVAVFFAMAVCWIPVIGTAAAVMGAVWAWGWPWWLAVAAYLAPKVIFILGVRYFGQRFSDPNSSLK